MDVYLKTFVCVRECVCACAPDIMCNENDANGSIKTELPLRLYKTRNFTFFFFLSRKLDLSLAMNV
jgi:hypothetical protein